MTPNIGDPCPDCGEILTDYNGMPVCASCYEKAVYGEVLIEDSTNEQKT